MIDGWKQEHLGNIAELRNGLNFTQSSVGQTIKVIGVGDFLDHESMSDFSKTASVAIEGRVAPTDLLADDDLLFVRSNGSKKLVGRCVLLQKVREPIGFSGFTIRARIKSELVDPRYLSKVAQSPLFKQHLDRLGGGSSISNLSQASLETFEFPIPPLAEQRKIAEILGAWDEAIEKSAAVLDAKTRLYSRLVEALIFDGSSKREERPSRRLGDITRELTSRNASAGLGLREVMGVSNSKGIVPMRSQTIGSDLARYKILPPRGFAYNPMRLNVGSIAMSNLAGDVLVSPDYVLFECIDGELDAEYFDHLRRTHWWNHHVNVGGSGSVRVRTYYKELAALHVKLPTFSEQRAIASALNTAQAEIALLGRSIAALKQQKRGLMQKLLTGQWRVNVGDTA